MVYVKSLLKYTVRIKIYRQKIQNIKKFPLGLLVLQEGTENG